jgi:hypothetical protein
MANRETKISALLRKVENDPHAAAELLALAADYLKGREALPDALADYLADAFRQAARTKPPKNGKRIEDERINQLAHGLYMKRSPDGGAPRKDVPKGDVALAVAAFGGTVSETKLKAEFAAAYDVSEGTARSRIKEAKAELADASEKAREILEANELKSIVRQR